MERESKEDGDTVSSAATGSKSKPSFVEKENTLFIALLELHATNVESEDSEADYYHNNCILNSIF